MAEKPVVTYAREPGLGVAEFRSVLVASGLDGIRPVDDEGRLAAMLSGATLIVTARLQGPGRPLVGVARGVTDGVWCCYLSELAVDERAQGLGVGRGLLDESRRQLGPGVGLFLAAVPDSVGFYERVGMARISDAFRFPRTS